MNIGKHSSDAKIRILPAEESRRMYFVEGERSLAQVASQCECLAYTPTSKPHEERSMLNVIDISMVRLPTPVRKKKSWLRYTSNKKWARKCPARFIRKVGYPKVLSVPKSLLDKIKALVDNNPMDAVFMNPRPKKRS